MQFGVLCNGVNLQKWQLEAIQYLISGGHTCSVLIENANPDISPSFTKRLINYPYSKFFVRFWFRFMMKPEAKEMVNISAFSTNIPILKCITKKQGFAQFFSETDVDAIKTFHLDFILRFGFSILKGDILESAKYGIWSYHHDDDRKYRGVPTGFWEIMFGDPINAAILQRLTNKLDSGIILHKSYFATIQHSWEANFNNLLQSSTEWPLLVCRRIENGDSGFLTVSQEPESKIYKLPSNFKMLRFGILLLKNKLIFHFRDLFISEKWNIGIVKTDIKTLLKPGEVFLPEPEWLNISSQQSIYHADPFGFVHTDTTCILCEEYDYKNPHGILVSLQLDNKTNLIKNKTVALEKEHHLAFPYILKHDGQFYCIPESSDGGNVEMYSYDIASGKLCFECTLISNLQAVDPSLFFYNGYWWLFFTDRKSTNERLYIWYSKELKGKYLPHANNPVKVDVRSSRPSGNAFILDNILFRPAQDCSIRSGRRISINKIIRISPTEFEEEVYSIINPSVQSKWRKGMHTFCVSEGAIIVDGKQERFIWSAFTKKIKIKISRIFK